MSSEVNSEVTDIKINIVEMAEKNAWKVSNNLDRIAKVKHRFFGLSEWNRCPCYPSSDTIHGCGTEACSKQIEEDGKCHCNLYLKE